MDFAEIDDLPARRRRISRNGFTFYHLRIERSPAMKVYVAVAGMYSSQCVVGVYVTPEAAMAAHPIPKDQPYPSVPSAADSSTPVGWHKTAWGDWSNGLDWDSHVNITEYELEG